MAFRLCPSCGYVIIDPSQPCVSCGAMPGPEIPPAVKAPAAQPPVAPPPPAEPFPVTPAAAYTPPRAKPKKRGRGKVSKIMKVVVVVVLLAAAACAALVMLPASDKPLSVAWERRFGGSGYDTATSAQQTADGGHVFAGSTMSNDGDISGRRANQEAYVVKLDASDGMEWQRLLGSSASDNQFASSVQQTGDGGYILAGKDLSDSYSEYGSVDVWIVKLNPTGDIKWQRYFGGSRHEEAYSISQTKDGGYIFSGRTDSRDGDVSGNQGDGGSGDDAWIVKLSADGDIEWQRRIGGFDTDAAPSALQTGDGGYIVAVNTNSNDGDAPDNHGGYDALIVKLNAEGGTEWQRCFGGSGNDYVSSIQPTKDGGYIAAGNTASGDGDLADSPGGQGAWIFKMDAAGNAEWHKRLAAPPDNSYAAEVQQTGGGYIVVGHTSPSGNVPRPRAWIVNLSESGDVGWQKYLSDTSSDWRHFVSSAEPTGNGGFIISGQTSPNFANAEEIDAWVARLIPDDEPAADEDVPFPGEDDDAPASSRNSLLGTWRTTFQGSESEVTYRSDGTFSERTGGMTAEGTYSIEGNRLTVVAPGIGRNVSTFEIEGDVLTEKPIHVEVNGQDVTSAMQGMTITSTRVR